MEKTALCSAKATPYEHQTRRQQNALLIKQPTHYEPPPVFSSLLEILTHHTPRPLRVLLEVCFYRASEEAFSWIFTDGRPESLAFSSFQT